MALDDDAALVVAQGFVFINDVAALAPTPSQVDTLDPDTFGADVRNIKVTNTATKFTLTFGEDTTADITLPATAEQVQNALEALESVGPGNIDIKGESATDTDGFTIALIGDKMGTAFAVTGTATGTGTPTVTVTQVASPNGWVNVGHTSRDDLPEFGFDGGKKQMRGTWQRKRLREVESGDPTEDSLKFTLEQFDRNSLELYFGEDAADTSGVFGVDGNFTPVEKSVFVVLVDGDARVGFYASKAEISRDASIKMPLDNFAGLPVKATFLNYGTRRLYDWISLDLLGSA
ncbi:hypothetical protein MINTMi198_17340 [Mycobacterium intracellulare M.i.198]|uniref:phage tail tube protein n=1 Tax=Mycobacterium intracellulare TaxID=1767 RepID=UPI0002F4B149|nr:hypothetical protein [Mycobacterium intracellulare]BCP36364.1 hypothetical protein MINTMi198_17340 [Mycobacterium intracellulare M.i.198]